MKKVLSIILAVMMIAACAPMAFAEGECRHEYDVHVIMNEGYDNCEKCGVRSADFTECFKAYVKLYGKAWSVGYSKTDNGTILNRYYNDANNGYDIWKLHCAAADEQDFVNNATKAVNEYIETLNDEYIIVYDATELVSALFRIEALSMAPYNEKVLGMFSEDILEEPLKLYKRYTDLVEGISMGDVVDREECIEYGKSATDLLSGIVSCIDGNHDLGNFTDNGDGTHSADCTFCNTKDVTSEHEWGEYFTSDDGSKTAKCKYCDATDTDNFEKDIRDFFELLINLIKSFIEVMFK